MFTALLEAIIDPRFVYEKSFPRNAHQNEPTTPVNKKIVSADDLFGIKQLDIACWSICIQGSLFEK